MENDTISRQAAIDAVCERIRQIGYENNPLVLSIRQAIRDLPSAQPEQRKGKWMSHYDYCKKHELLPSGLIAFWWCDQCGEGVEHRTNFCPSCGADMRGETDE